MSITDIEHHIIDYLPKISGSALQLTEIQTDTVEQLIPNLVNSQQLGNQFVWFDQSGNSASRYSMLLPHPIASLRSNQDDVWLDDIKVNASFADATHSLHQLASNALRKAVRPSDTRLLDTLPFHLGLAGYLAYDVGHNAYQLSFNKTGYSTPTAQVGLFLEALIVDHQNQCAHYLSLSNMPNRLAQIKQLVSQTQSNNELPFTLLSPLQADTTYQQYERAFSAVQEHLVAGNAYQINLCQRWQAYYEGSPLALYQQLRVLNQAPFSSYIPTRHGAVLCHSPERFIQVNDRVVETKPIKGTMPRGQNPHTDSINANALSSSEKDRAENLMIVDLLRNDLSKHCVEHSVTVPELFALESYRNVHHMVSTIRATLKPECSPLTLLFQAFPGGSITGAPKKSAMQIIDQLESSRRHIFCGTIFYCDSRDHMDSAICIRTLLAEKGRLFAWAGGGITVSSNVEAEYQECLDKLSNIIKINELFGREPSNA